MFDLFKKLGIMNQRYIVEITKIDTSTLQLERLARRLKTSPEKLKRLVKVVPGPATKAISEAEAQVICRYFNEAGLHARVISASQAVKTAVVVNQAKPHAASVNPNEAFTPIEPDEIRKLFGSQEPVVKLASEPQPAARPAREGRSSRSASSLPIFEIDPAKTLPPPKQVEGLNTQARESLSEPKKRFSLRQKLRLALLVPILITSMGVLAVAGLSMWQNMQAQSLEVALLSTKSSAATLSRSIEGNGDISQFRNLPSPVPEQNQVTIEAVVSSNISAQAFAAWPPDLSLSNTLNSLIQEQAALVVATGTASQTKLTQSRNPFASQLIMTSQALEHGSAIVGSVTTIYSYAPMIAYWQSLFARTALLSLLPIALALLVGWFSLNAISKTLLDLIQHAEALSKGKLSNSIQIKRNDELKDLGTSLERLRVSTKTSLEKLRERRERGF